MTPLESSVSDGTIWSVTIKLSITILEASFTIVYDVYSISVTYDNRQLMIVICLWCRPLIVFQDNGLKLQFLFTYLSRSRHLNCCYNTLCD
jgi:hypothetical protein